MSANFSKNSTTIVIAAGIVGIIVLAGLLSSRSQVQPASVKTTSTTALERGQNHYSQGRYEEAIRIFEAYLAQAPPEDPQVPLVRDLLASCYWQTEKHQKAFDLLKVVVQARPADSDSLYRLGLLASELDELKMAEVYFAQAIAAKPGQSPYHTAFAETLSKLDKQEQAREQWHIVLSLTPGDSPYQATVHGKIGDTYMAQNLPESAAAEFQTGLAIEPDDQYLKTQLAAMGR